MDNARTTSNRLRTENQELKTETKELKKELGKMKDLFNSEQLCLRQAPEQHENIKFFYWLVSEKRSFVFP